MDKKLKSLDILKGLGILMIIMVHNRHFIMKDTSGLRGLINYGQMGCQLFFLVSGMALCYTWSHMSDDDAAGKSGRPRLKDRLLRVVRFLLRRYLRLAPGFYLILCVNFLLNVLFMDVLGHSPGFIMNREPAAILTNVLFLHGLFPDYINSVFPGGWYIGTTVLLYAIFPLLVTLFEKLYAHSNRIIVVLPAVFLALNCLLLWWITKLSHGGLYPSNNSFLYYFFTNQLPCFSLGILLYFQEKGQFSRRCPLAVSIPLTVVTGVVCVCLYLKPEQDYIYTVLPSVAGLSFYWLAVCLLHIEHTRKAPPRSKVWRPLTWFGNFLASCGRNSYAMYLVHAFVSWYGMKDLTYFLNLYGIAYNDLALYLILYIPSVFVIYVLGLYMGLLLEAIDRRIRNRKKTPSKKRP